MNLRNLKETAKVNITGKIGFLFLCALIYVGIGSAGNIIPVVGSIAVMLLLPTLEVGQVKIYLMLADNEEPTINDLFNYFSYWWNLFVAYFLMCLYLCLWSILFVIPAIVKGYSYSMTFYILADNPGMSANDAITRSRRLMDGHKWDLFVLHFSFFFWFLLVIVTFGFAAIYVYPYVSASTANFYRTISETYPEHDEEDPFVEEPAEPSMTF